MGRAPLGDFLLLGLARREEVSETVSTLYDTIHSPGQFVIYVGLVVLVSLVMFWGFGRCMGGTDAYAPLLPDATMELVFFAYLGAYVSSVQELVRRYNTFDLQPQVYSSIAIRMLIAVAIVYVAAPVLETEPAAAGGGDEPAWPMVVAFVIGVFPTQGLHFLSRIATRFDTQQIVDGVDQAILHVRVGDRITSVFGAHLASPFPVPTPERSSP